MSVCNILCVCQAILKSIPNKHCKPSVGPPASPPHQLRAVIGRALVALQKVQEHMTGERKPDIGT